MRGQDRTDEWKDIFDNGDDDGIDYSDLGDEWDDEDDDEELAVEQAIERLKGTIKDGDCMFCGSKGTAHYDGNFFFCKECHYVVEEDFYYRWYAGFPVEID